MLPLLFALLLLPTILSISTRFTNPTKPDSWFFERFGGTHFFVNWDSETPNGTYPEKNSGDEFFLIQNNQQAPMKVHEVCFSEHRGNETLQVRYFRNLPIIYPDYETVQLNYSFVDLNDSSIEQRWTCVVEYENFTYIPRQPVVCHYTPRDHEYGTLLFFNFNKDLFTVEPPHAKNNRTKMVVRSTPLNDTTPEILMDDLNEFKKQAAQYVKEGRRTKFVEF